MNTLSALSEKRLIHPSIDGEIERLVREHPQSLVTLLTPIGKIVYTGPGCEFVIGYTQAELTGRYFGLYVHPADIPHALLALQDAMLNERSVKVSARVRRKSREYIWVKGEAWRVNDPGSGKTYLLSLSSPRDEQL